MEKLNIKKLIANDIVNYGMDKTMNFQYIVSLDDFLNDYDEETKTYIKANIADIEKEILNHESVSDLSFDKTRNEFDMVFYINSLLNPLERKIYDYISREDLDADIELDEVREIAYNIENSKSYDELIKTSILNKYCKDDLLL